ncbi:peptidoglycan-binding protein [Cronbergia sp. UHCC 0137]|uniref:peptidoglycan-binding protein n=1 Tax=Cronbergia sp. UHCC 0137 TaxID=3110239 RepID=UPI002B1EF5CF|nr:peptidoglycan-binding protein [Cronbergia sp. UHCC 0137]MEA5618693.1 peptidoglycan-binding protein [Cronbergia sp. UHCC 0137]
MMATKLILNANEVLRLGSKGSKVRQLQEILQALNLNPGPIDGDFGQRTLASVNRFQQQQGLTRDGVVGPRTQNALNKSIEQVTQETIQSDSKPIIQKPDISSDSSNKLQVLGVQMLTGNEILRLGSKGSKVRQLQEILKALNLDPGQIDGDFGQKTLASVKRFQQQQGLTPDGVVGPRTQNALNQFIQNSDQKTETVKSNPSSISSTSSTLYGGKSGKIPLPGVVLIKKFEGFDPNAYPDPLSGGKPITIGWGSTRKKDGSEWKIGDRITREMADELLMLQLENSYLPPLEKIPVWQELNVNQRGALLSFAYNLGANFYGNRNFTSMTRVLRDKQWNEIEETFLKYRNPGTSVEAGLRRRRQEEAKLFLTPV